MDYDPTENIAETKCPVLALNGTKDCQVPAAQNIPVLRRLLAKKFTAVADFHQVLRSDYLRMRFQIDNIPVAHINKHRHGKRQLTSQSNKKLVQQPTSFENYAEVLRKLGYPVDLQFTSIFPPAGGDLRLLPSEIGQKKAFQQWIGIAPFAAHRGKIYPEQKMERVIGQLLAEHANARLFFFGGGGHERDVINQWCQQYPRCLAHRYARGQHLGRHPSLRRVHGMEPARRPRHPAAHELPALQHLRQQALSAGRLCLPERHRSRNNRRENQPYYSPLKQTKRI